MQIGSISYRKNVEEKFSNSKPLHADISILKIEDFIVQALLDMAVKQKSKGENSNDRKWKFCVL